MTAIATPLLTRTRTHGSAWAEAAALVAGLGAIVVARWAATRLGLDALAIGTAFGGALGVLALAGARRFAVSRPGPRGVAWGLVFGAGLLAAAIVGPWLAGATHSPGLGRPAVPVAPWAIVTVIVAVAEEAMLRGVLFDRFARAGGTFFAVLATSAVFALMHVPLYGWHVVPLDLAVGLGLGGLRVLTRGITAPAAAHALSDLASWWL
jgi:membrane protease YdiL (CAAX protease family)